MRIKKIIKMNKKGDVNWFLVMAILALAALLVILLISGGVFSKFFKGFGGITNELDIKAKCMPEKGDVDNDGDGYKGNNIQVTVDDKEITCDIDDSDPLVYPGKEKKQ